MTNIDLILNSKDRWKNPGSYENYMGRWSRLVAPRFLDWLAAPPQRSWLDFGCGTGALTQTILSWSAPKRVLAIDPSQEFVSHARALTVDSRVEFKAVGLEALRGEKFDIIVSGLVLNLLPKPYDGLAAMKHLTIKGGTIAAYVWDYIEGMAILRYFWDAAVALDESVAGLDEARRFPLCRSEALRGLFDGAGLQDVVVDSIEIPTEFASFEDYWRPFDGGQGPAPGYVSSLSPQKRAELKKRLSETLPFSGDGSIRLTAKAWAVRGSK